MHQDVDAEEPRKGDTPETRALEAIRDAGYYAKEIVRILPPRDTGHDAEVLFIGRPRSKGVSEPLTAYVADRPDGDRPPALIAAGW